MTFGADGGTMDTTRTGDDQHVSEADLVRYIDGELTVAERARVAEHLLGCRGCAAELESLRSARDGFAALLAGSPVEELDSARRAMTFAALQAAAEESAPAPDIAPRREAPGVRTALRLLRAAAVGAVLLGGALVYPPSRAAVADLFNAAVDRAERIAGIEQPVAEQRIRLTGTGIGYIPRSETFVVEIESRQNSGALVLGVASGASVNATAHGGHEIVDLVILPGGMRIANTSEATSDYAVSLPQTLRQVRVIIPGEEDLVLTMNELSSSWVSVVDLSSSDQRDN